MQTDTTLAATSPALAAQLIKRWKGDPELRNKYANNAGSFFLKAEWQADENLRLEFNNDYESFCAFSRRAG